MKYFSFLIFFLIINSCKSKDVIKMVANINENSTIKTTDCPKKMICSVDILKEKDLLLGKNDIGQLFPKVIDGDKIVIKYLSKLEGESGITDGQNSEMILFVIDKETKTSLKDGELKNINMVFQKNCYCKDIFGYYNVELGSFNIKSNKNKSEIDIEFTIPKLGSQQLVNKVHLILE